MLTKRETMLSDMDHAGMRMSFTYDKEERCAVVSIGDLARMHDRFTNNAAAVVALLRAGADEIERMAAEHQARIKNEQGSGA